MVDEFLNSTGNFLVDFEDVYLQIGGQRGRFSYETQKKKLLVHKIENIHETIKNFESKNLNCESVSKIGGHRVGII